MAEEKPETRKPAWGGSALAIGCVAAAAIAIFAFKGVCPCKPSQAQEGVQAASGAPSAAAPRKEEAKAERGGAIAEAPKPALKTPRLVDLGAGKCIPCKAMAPILEDLKKAYEGKLAVEFIDVWERQEEAAKYKISLIPTQIFFDAEGKELFRHEGFFSKEEILAKCKELGFSL